VCYRRRRTVEGRLQNPEEVDRVEDRSNREALVQYLKYISDSALAFLVGPPLAARTRPWAAARGSSSASQPSTVHWRDGIERRSPGLTSTRPTSPSTHGWLASQSASVPPVEQPISSTRRPRRRPRACAVAASCRVPRHVVRWKHAVLQCMWRDARCNLARGVMRGEAWTGCARCNALCAMDDVLHGVYIKGDLCDAVRGCDVAWTHGVTHDVTHRV